jgi:hypothetical protein
MAGTITHYWDGTKLYITSDSGTTCCDLRGPRGAEGIRGPQGAPGRSAAGASPLVGVTEIPGGHRVTIIDKDGPNTFDVMDGTAEDIDLSNYYTKDETAEVIANTVSNLDIPDGTPIATGNVAGKVKPDNSTVFVSADGTLSATVQGVEIQEVYVGTSAPTSPNAMIWINPNEGSAAVAATTNYVEDTVGDISTALDILNGEVV